jgi:hypothetical protein
MQAVDHASLIILRGKNLVYDYDKDLTSLEEWLRRLKTEYHIFFNGNRKKPPDDLRMRLERLVKKLSECSDMSYSQRFRLNTLITRFYVYRDLWRRTMLDYEIGLDSKSQGVAGTAAPSTAAKPQKELVRVSISDPKTDSDKVQKLYDTLLQLKGANLKELPASYRQFEEYVATQTSRIRGKHGCPSVAFAIALEDDAIRFIAVAENL